LSIKFNSIKTNRLLYFSESTRWLLSIHKQIEPSEIEFKLLLPLIPLSFSSDSLFQSYNYQSIQITSSRILYYLFHCLSNDHLCTQLRQIKFPQTYALFLKNLSRLIKPTTSLDLSMDLIWELMPDIDEHQKYSLQPQQNVQMINNIIPDIWGEIGRIFYLSFHEE